MIEVQGTVHHPVPRALLRGPRLSRAARGMGSSVLREVMDLTTRPGVLSFAVGLPAAELFPREALAEAMARVLSDDAAALQYALPLQELKEQIVGIMALRGVCCRPEQVFLTGGAQQAMDLLAHLLLDPGGQVLLEETVYDGIRIAVRRFDPRILTVPSDATPGSTWTRSRPRSKAVPVPRSFT